MPHLLFVTKCKKGGLMFFEHTHGAEEASDMLKKHIDKIELMGEFKNGELIDSGFKRPDSNKLLKYMVKERVRLAKYTRENWTPHLLFGIRGLDGKLLFLDTFGAKEAKNMIKNDFDGVEIVGKFTDGTIKDLGFKKGDSKDSLMSMLNLACGGLGKNE